MAGVSGVQYGPDACAVHPGHRHALNADGVEICWVRETVRPCDIPCNTPAKWDYQQWRERIVYDHLEDIIRSAERAMNDLHEAEIKRAAVEGAKPPGRWITGDELREIEEAAYRRGEESR